ncbi:MAG: TlyA family RNA methyltransferase [Chloroflexi bacterium]|nr:TlyA family RNA methyltransferase [Chloroflexota bacterium]
MAANTKIRLDRLLVDRSLAPDIKAAAALVMAGKVSVTGERRAPTPGMHVRPGAVVTVAAGNRFVSRGGEKLAGALEQFNVRVDGAVCLDVGSSTGGFTDCLLQNGASRVYAVDTGRGQLHQKLLNDDRVVSMERTNIARGIELPEKVDLVVVDVSFTSLRTVLPPALTHLAEKRRDLANVKTNVPDSTRHPQAVVLLKPQFEARKSEVPRGGVITDSIVHAAVIGRFIKWAGDSKIRVRNLVS